MNFLLTIFLLLQARTPNNANAAPSESYNTFGVSGWWFVIAVVLVVLAFAWAWKKGMLSWLPDFKTSTKHVQTKPPPPPSDGPPTGPINV